MTEPHHATHSRKGKTGRCSLTGNEYPLRELVPGNTVREPIDALIRQQYPD
jgi:hypothetical protein